MSNNADASSSSTRANDRLWAWGQRALARAAELEAWSKQIQHDHGSSPLVDQANMLLRNVRDAADGRRPWFWRRSMWVDRTVGNTNAAYCLLLRAVPNGDLPGYLPQIVAFVQEHLEPQDPRRLAVERVANAQLSDKAAITTSDREMLASGVHEAHQIQEREYVRLRHFRALVLYLASALSVVVVGLAVVGFLFPEMLPICFRPERRRACPTGDGPRPWDYALIEGIGLIAASIAAAAALRKTGGTATPYEVPAALGVLKLPTGALTALLGLLLMRGGFIPGLSALDSAGQIMAWAIVLGYAQELFTRLVDQKGQEVLNAVGMAEEIAAPIMTARPSRSEQPGENRPT